MENHQVAIVGAGTSGLLACKYILEKGFSPIVFEAEEGIGGIWARTIASTKLQNTKESYQFSDFPWPESAAQVFPSHTQVMKYLDSYARHFGVFPYIKFNSKVIGIDYIGESYEEMDSWHLWSGTGKAFGSRGKWNVEVQDVKNGTKKVYQAEFVILCLGLHSGLPNIPHFPPNQGPEVFNGNALHSMDYSAMDDTSAIELIKRRRVTVIGSQKSALDIASECAKHNGALYPCTLIQRTPHWYIPSNNLGGINLGFLYLNRFSELLVHKPGETLWLSLLATLLSPLRWTISKFVESYIKWKLPLKKYGMIPKCSFLQDISSCQISMLPENFFNQVEKESITVKRSKSFRFCREGLLLEGEAHPHKTDIVIFATGYRGDVKLTNIFKSPFFRKCIYGSSEATLPLYRQIIHPQIPQLAIVGYAENLSNLYAAEIRCQWLVHLLSGKIQLPPIREMAKEVRRWDDYMKQYAQNRRRTCVTPIRIWDSDQLCKDMGYNPRRKKGLFSELFEPYGPADYAGLTRMEKC